MVLHEKYKCALWFVCPEVAYMFGQTKKTGEANMYPKPMQDLYGWNVRSVACGVTATVIAADNSVISFGPSPAFGELVSNNHWNFYLLTTVEH